MTDMDDKEHDEILYRLDERTKRVDEHINRLEEHVAENSNEIENLDDRLQNTEKDLLTAKGVIAFVTALFSGLAAKLGGMF